MLSGFWGVDASNMGAPTPGRCSPVFSVLDPQHPEASFGAGLPMASMHPLHNPAMPEGLYNQMMEPKVCGISHSPFQSCLSDIETFQCGYEYACLTTTVSVPAGQIQILGECATISYPVSATLQIQSNSLG